MRTLLGLVFVGLSVLPVSAQKANLSDQQIVQSVIQDSRNQYYATGRPCACPYDNARNGSSCGGRSAYSRPGGAEPKCFPKDVTATDIASYRASTTLADLFMPFLFGDLSSAVPASLRSLLNDDIDDGLAHGRQARLRRWTVDSFFSVPLVRDGDPGGMRKRSCS
jgi:hypothetical protein